MALDSTQTRRDDGRRRKRPADEEAEQGRAAQRARAALDSSWTVFATPSALNLPSQRLCWLEATAAAHVDTLVPQPYGFGWVNYQVTDVAAKWRFVLGGTNFQLTDDRGFLLPDVGIWSATLTEAELTGRRAAGAGGRGGGGGGGGGEDGAAAGGMDDAHAQTLWGHLVSRAAPVTWSGSVQLSTQYFGPPKGSDLSIAPGNGANLSPQRFPLTQGQTTYVFYFFSRTVDNVSLLSFPIHLSSSRNPVPRRNSEGFCSGMKLWMTPHSVSASRPTTVFIIGELPGAVSLFRNMQPPYDYASDVNCAAVEFRYEHLAFVPDDPTKRSTAKAAGKMVTSSRALRVTTVTMTQGAPGRMFDGLAELDELHVTQDIDMYARQMLHRIAEDEFGTPLPADIIESLNRLRIFNEDDFAHLCPRRAANEGLAAEVLPFAWNGARLLWKRYKLNSADDCDQEKERERASLSKQLLWELLLLLRVRNDYLVVLEGVSIVRDTEPGALLPYKFTGIVTESLLDIKLHKCQPRPSPTDIATVGLHMARSLKGIHSHGFVFRGVSASHVTFDERLRTYKLVGGSKAQPAHRPYDPRCVADVQQLLNAMQMLLGNGTGPSPDGEPLMQEINRMRQMVASCDDQMRADTQTTNDVPAAIVERELNEFLSHQTAA